MAVAGERPATSPWGPAFGAFGPPQSPRSFEAPPAPLAEPDMQEASSTLEDIDLTDRPLPRGASNSSQLSSSGLGPISRTPSNASRASLNQPLRQLGTQLKDEAAVSTRTIRILAALLIFVSSAEVWILCLATVPWIIDKAFFVLCLVFQLLLAVSLTPVFPGSTRSKVVDICHWAFVVLVYLGALVLGDFHSVFLIALLAFATVALRLAMGNHCIITMVAQHSSLPSITDRQTTSLFTGLLAISIARLGLMSVYGNGSVVQEILALCGYTNEVPTTAALLVSAGQILARNTGFVV